MSDQLQPEHEDINEMMWCAFVQWAISEPDFRAAFKADTGMSLDSPKHPLERMIDEATGFQGVVFRKFIEWVTVEHWGIEYAPKKFRDEYAAKVGGADE